jgi:predicted Co/Zn/Cd cation transporter (cation efflux family)
MNTRYEQNILTFSACGALFFAILALIWGILTKSQMIMFDGVYSFISLILTGFYFYAAKSMMLGSDKKFPFGRSQIEPMVITVQSIVLIAICIKALTSSTISLFSGGQEINSLSGMTYAFIGVIGCFIAWSYIMRTKKKKAPQSVLLKTQSMQWLMDTMLSGAVLIGFFIGYILQSMGYEYYAQYTDPLMVIIAVLFFIRGPIISLIEGIKGLLIMAPEKGIYKTSKQAMKTIARQKKFEDVVLRLGKSGRELVCEVSFITKTPKDSRSVGEMDEIHKEVYDKLSEMFDSPLWLCVSFVHNRKLT